MQALNLSLFEWLAAGHSPNSPLLWLASLIAVRSSWLCFAIVAWAAWRKPAQRAYLMATLFAIAVAALAAHELAQVIATPRPFIVGLSPAYIDHGARGSMPSAHASVMFTLALVLALRAPLRAVAGWIFAIALLTGWARVYVGVHFPLDIAGGLLLALVVTAAFAGLHWLVRRFVLPMIARDTARGEGAADVSEVPTAPMPVAPDTRPARPV